MSPRLFNCFYKYKYTEELKIFKQETNKYVCFVLVISICKSFMRKFVF